MKCPRCEHEKTYVLKTTVPTNKPADITKQRRRECQKCKRPFMTFEILEADFERLCKLIKLEGPTRSPLRTRTPPESDESKS
jgi:transcriptional regulator NrdR family protein